jgi:hypothetical protein
VHKALIGEGRRERAEESSVLTKPQSPNTKYHISLYSPDHYQFLSKFSYNRHPKWVIDFRARNLKGRVEPQNNISPKKLSKKKKKSGKTEVVE